MKLLFWVLLVVCYLILSKPIFAKIELLDYPAKIEINKEFTVSVNLTNLSDPIHFLSIAFQKKKGDDYFGQTKNGESWVEAEKANCKSFPQIEVKEGSWSGKLTGRIIFGEKDFDNSLGDYTLKVIKYTDSCNQSSSNELLVTLFSTDPPPDAPTVTPKLSLKLTSAPHLSSTPKLQQNTPTIPFRVMPSVTKISSIVVINTDGPAVKDYQKAEVLGEELIQLTEDKEEKDASSSINKKFSLPLLFGLILGGVICITGAVWSSIQRIRKHREK